MALEQETDAILRLLTERTIGEDDSYRLESLMQADVPPGIRSFFHAEVWRKLESELGRSSWFAGIRQSDAGAARVARALLMSLTEAHRFPRQEFLDTLDIGVHFVANYLCRPRWTLENFLFDRSQQISLAALSSSLAYVADYRYLGDLVIRSLQRRGQNEIGREEFQTLIGKIDEEVVRRHNARELASLTKPLFHFFQIPGTHPDGAIPVEALLVFFEDKKMRILKEYIRGIGHVRNRSHLTNEELARLIEDLYAGNSAGNTTPVPPPIEVPPASEVPAPAAESPASSPSPAQERPAPTGESQKANVALSLTFAGLQGRVVPRPQLPEIRMLIQPGQQDRFIAEVFKGDAAHYAGALVMLDSLKTWPDAEAFLAELYRTNNLDPRAADAIEFSEIVRRRYATTEKAPR